MYVGKFQLAINWAVINKKWTLFSSLISGKYILLENYKWQRRLEKELREGKYDFCDWRKELSREVNYWYFKIESEFIEKSQGI